VIRFDRVISGRGAALALLGFLLVAVWIGPTAVYLGFVQAGSDDIERQSALLQRYRTLAEVPQPGLSSAAAASDLLSPEVPDSQAVARLQEMLKTAATAAQVQIQGFQILRAEPLPGAVKVGVRLRGSGDVAALSRLLYAVESARPLLLPDNLQVQARATAPTAAASAPEPGPVPLDFQFDVSAFKAGASS
jgi:hypothetical protein